MVSLIAIMAIVLAIGQPLFSQGLGDRVPESNMTQPAPAGLGDPVEPENSDNALGNEVPDTTTPATPPDNPGNGNGNESNSNYVSEAKKAADAANLDACRAEEAAKKAQEAALKVEGNEALVKQAKDAASAATEASKAARQAANETTALYRKIASGSLTDNAARQMSIQAMGLAKEAKQIAAFTRGLSRDAIKPSAAPMIFTKTIQRDIGKNGYQWVWKDLHESGVLGQGAISRLVDRKINAHTNHLKEWFNKHYVSNKRFDDLERRVKALEEKNMPWWGWLLAIIAIAAFVLAIISLLRRGNNGRSSLMFYEASKDNSARSWNNRVEGIANTLIGSFHGVMMPFATIVGRFSNDGGIDSAVHVEKGARNISVNTTDPFIYAKPGEQRSIKLPKLSEKIQWSLDVCNASCHSRGKDDISEIVIRDILDPRFGNYNPGSAQLVENNIVKGPIPDELIQKMFVQASEEESWISRFWPWKQKTQELTGGLNLSELYDGLPPYSNNDYGRVRIIYETIRRPSGKVKEAIRANAGVPGQHEQPVSRGPLYSINESAQESEQQDQNPPDKQDEHQDTEKTRCAFIAKIRAEMGMPSDENEDSRIAHSRDFSYDEQFVRYAIDSQKTEKEEKAEKSGKRIADREGKLRKYVENLGGDPNSEPHKSKITELAQRKDYDEAKAQEALEALTAGKGTGTSTGFDPLAAIKAGARTKGGSK